MAVLALFALWILDLRAQDVEPSNDSFLPTETVDALNQEVELSDVFIYEEIARLNMELEDLNTRLAVQSVEVDELQLIVEGYEQQTYLAAYRSEKIEELQLLLVMPPFEIGASDPDYSYAYQAIMLDNIEVGKSYMLRFLTKYFPEALPNVSNDAVITQGTDTDSASEVIAGVATGVPVLDEEISESRQDDLNFLKVRALFILGEISLIENNSIEALSFFSATYYDTIDVQLSFLALFRAVVILDYLGSGQDICFLLQQIRELSQIEGATELIAQIYSDEMKEIVQQISGRIVC